MLVLTSSSFAHLTLKFLDDPSHDFGDFIDAIDSSRPKLPFNTLESETKKLSHRPPKGRTSHLLTSTSIGYVPGMVYILTALHGTVRDSFLQTADEGTQSHEDQVTSHGNKTRVRSPVHSQACLTLTCDAGGECEELDQKLEKQGLQDLEDFQEFVKLGNRVGRSQRE